MDVLFPRIRQSILARILLSPEKSWYLSELSEHLQVTPSSLQRDLANLVQAEILIREKRGNMAYYRANPVCPIFKELQSIFIKTSGLSDVLRNMLSPFLTGIKTAFVFGSIPRADAHSESDIDLFVIGDITLADLAPELIQGEKKLGRDIQVVIFTKEEFSKKLSENDHFVCSVLREDKLFIVGDKNDLERFTGNEQSPEI